MSDARAAAVRLERPWLGTEWLRFFESSVEEDATPAIMLGAAGVGIAFDLALRSGVSGVAGTICVAVATAVVLASGRVRNPHAMALVCTAPLFGVWLMLRTSEWLVPLNVLAAAALLGFGASLSRGGSGLDLTIPEIFGRVARGSFQALFAPSFALRAFNVGTHRLGAVARGLLIVVPLFIVLGALLTSADAVFASFFSVDLGSVAGHLIAFALGTTAMAGLLRLASTEPVETPDVESPKLGAVETFIVLAALNVLLGSFAVARLIALSEGGRRVIASAGLTYAEYARTGFFQLLAVAVIVVAALLTLRAAAGTTTARQRNSFVGLSLGVVALTLAVCVSAFHRLVLYESAFGLTMLRVFVQTAIVWVAVVLVLLGVSMTIDTARAWLAPAAALAALVLLFALNVLNPEAFVARHNVTHPTKVDAVDAAYLFELSDDAVPSIVSAARGKTPEAIAVRSRICDARPQPEGWASFNLSHDRARRVRLELC